MAEGLTILEAVLLGIVQGLTEWLPVSSSGHLVLVQQGLGLQADLLFDLFLHVGTLAVVLLFYRETVADILAATARLPRELSQRGASALTDDPARRLALLVVAGSVPTAIIGFTFEEVFVGWFTSTTAVAIGLLATGTWLYLSKHAPAPHAYGGLGLLAALLVGAAQGIAVAPGVSRSGATIGMALLLGMQRELAVRFSFLLSVPAILGATLFSLDAASLATAQAAWPAYLAGVLVSALVGYAALALLVLVVKRRGLHPFAWYCWAVGGLALWWGL